MPYSQPAQPTGPSLAGLMAQWRSQLIAPEKNRLRVTRHFFARFLKHLYPGLPDLPSGQQQLSGWFHSVDGQVLADTRRIFQTLKDPALTQVMDISLSTLRSYRYRLSPFLTWYATHRAQQAIPVQTLSAAWQTLFDLPETVQLSRCPRSYLHKLAQFATQHGCSPEEIATDLTAAFRHWLIEQSGLKDPHRVYRGARQAWSQLVEQGAVAALSFDSPLPHPTHTLLLKESDLPTAYRQLYEAYLRDARSTDPDDWPTADPHRADPLSEATIQTRLRYLLAYWGALAHYASVDLATTDPIDVFATPHYIEWYADFLAERSAGKRMAWHQGLLSWLCFFALDYLPRHAPDVPIVLAPFKSHLFKEPAHRRGQRPRYVPPETVEKVLAFMETRLEHLEKDRRAGSPTTLFSIRRDSFLISFLLDNGNRSADLRRAQLGREFIREKGHYIAQFKTKNGRTIRLALSPRTHRALEHYLDSREALELDHPTLILSRNGKPLAHGDLWTQVTRWFRRAVGLHFSPHDFRRTLASSVLKKTGDQDLAKLLLGDSSTQVIRDAYDVVETDTAYATWHTLLEAHAQGAVGALSPPTAKLLARLQDPSLAQRFHEQIERSQSHDA